MESPTTSDDLWSFAVRTYAREGVAAACLHLQDEHGLDVDVVLGCLWHAQRGGAWDEGRLARVLEAAQPAQQRIEQVRALRRAVGSQRDREPDWQTTYERLKDAELAAERVELARVEAVLRQAPHAVDPCEPATAALTALRAYAAARRRGDLDDPLPGLLQDLVALALPPKPPPEPAPSGGTVS